MISLKEKFNTTHLSTRSMAKELYNDLLHSDCLNSCLLLFSVPAAGLPDATRSPHSVRRDWLLVLRSFSVGGLTTYYLLLTT